MWLKLLFGVLLIYCVRADFDPFLPYSESEYEEFEPSRPQDPEGLSFRLANNTRPVHYDIWLSTAIHEADFRFNGTVHIRFRTLMASTNITLNFKQLTITNVDLFDLNRNLMQSNLLTTVDQVTELMVTYPNMQLPANQEFILTVDYNGIMRTDNYGYYRGFYVENGVQKWYGTTQFQATDARHAFPCYDEPQIRAAYTLHMRHHQSYHALGNRPIVSITPPDEFGYVITNFEEIPNMHSYLNAFTVSDFIYIENATVRPPQRIYGRRERMNNGDGNFALEVSPAIMKTCEEYYGFNYTFPKMDQVALTMFPAGAMENWGLVNYLEIFLLFDPLISTTLNRDNIIRIVAHEFMHQWIGNIINPQWWTYLWINEGFATLDQFYLSHLTFPQDRYMDTFYVTQTQPTFITDANPNIRHMSWYVESPAAILTLFDTISYPKAGSVLLTFQNAISIETWITGVRYLLLDRFHNFHTSEILYANLQRAVNEDHRPNVIPNIHTMMRTWEMQAGFPVVTVSRSGNTLTITQERFMYDRNLNSPNLWWIPLNYVVGSDPDFSSTRTDIFMQPVRTMTLTNAAAPKPWAANDWLCFNVQASSYIRVNYDNTLWQLLINQLNAANRGFERIHYRNRAQLIDDAHHLARGDRINFGIVLRLIEHMWQEIDYVPWMAADRTFTFLTPRLSGSRVFAAYQDFIRTTARTLFNYVGVQWIANEPRLDRFSRTIAMNLACRHQLPECLNSTNAELTAHVNQGRRIEPEYRASIYCNGLRTGNVLLFLNMQNRLLRTDGNQAERNNLIDGMACTQNTDLLTIHLNLAITPNVPLSMAERSRILTSPGIHGENALYAMMEFIEMKYDLILDEGPNLLPNMINSISNNIASEEIYTRFMLMMADLLCRNAITPQVFTQHLNGARTHLEWQSRYLGAIEEFFN